jgi:sigma-B regulation protein RsbU (phosphoserine phosphatase)
MGVPLRTRDDTIGLILLAGQTSIQNDLTISRGDILNQIGQLASIAIQNAQLFSQVQQARKESEAQKQRMENELEIARKVQLALLPQEYPSLEGWSFSALWKPAREVAGDFYDFISRFDGCMDLIIADVTDKGAPAALFMAHNKGMLRKSLENTKTLVEGVTNANRVMISENVGPFVTSFFARIDPGTGEITYVNAGHESPIWLKKNSDQVFHLPSTGLPLGVDLDLEYRQKTIQLGKGDLLILYTDGVIDAVDHQNNRYRKTRLLKVVMENRHRDAEEIAQNLLRDVESFIGKTSASDDIAIVVVQRY